MPTAESPAVLSVRNLRLWRGKTQILRGIDWEIGPGENWVMVGANGCGKTSLLSSLLGYACPSDGEIALLGERFGESDWRALRCQIGVVSSAVRQMMADEEPAVESVASGRYAMIDAWGQITKADLDKAAGILRRIGCGRLADRPWGALSQGERQRILIGRALMAEPRLLILDEPCAGLDPAAREHFLQFLGKFARRAGAPAIVLVTHHVEEITAIFTHCLVLRAGRVLAAGPIQKALNSENLAKAFGAPVRLRRRSGRYAVEFPPVKGTAVM